MSHHRSLLVELLAWLQFFSLGATASRWSFRFFAASAFADIQHNMKKSIWHVLLGTFPLAILFPNPLLDSPFTPLRIPSLGNESPPLPVGGLWVCCGWLSSSRSDQRTLLGWSLTLLRAGGLAAFWENSWTNAWRLSSKPCGSCCAFKTSCCKACRRPPSSEGGWMWLVRGFWAGRSRLVFAGANFSTTIVKPSSNWFSAFLRLDALDPPPPPRNI